MIKDKNAYLIQTITYDLTINVRINDQERIYSRKHVNHWTNYGGRQM